jgi:hypothetical protein
MGLCESMSYNPWFDEECLKFVDRRKQAKLQWLQDPSIVNEDSLRNVRREASRYFRNKIREYFKGKINEVELNSKNKNIRDLYSGIHGPRAESCRSHCLWLCSTREFHTPSEESNEIYTVN